MSLSRRATSRLPNPGESRAGRIAIASCVALLGVLPPSTATAQTGSEPDSADLVREARSAQGAFERTRVRHAPQGGWSGSGPCDERLGRFCLRLGSDDDPERTLPEEAPEVQRARDDLLETLARIAALIPGDAWVAGQRVAYLGEAGRWEEALGAARSCRAEGWWCRGLEGFALHGAGNPAEAERAFQVVLDALPPDRRLEWDDPGLLGEPEFTKRLDDREEDGLGKRARERAWALLQPLFILEGNALRSEHLARRMLAEIRSDARNGHGLSWGRDLTEILVRFGPVVGYERAREPPGYIGPPPVVGRHHPSMRHLVPTPAAVEDPVGSGPEDWRTDRRRARSRHGPPESPRIHGMESQTARFPRGDEVLAVAAWRLERPDHPVGADSALRFPPARIEAALYLVDPSGLGVARFDASSQEPGAAFAVSRAPPGGYLLSIEALDREGRRAWRHREGVELSVPHPGVVAISDLLLLAPEGTADGMDDGEGRPQPPVSGGQASLQGAEGLATSVGDPVEALLPRAFPGTAVPAGPVEVAWEVYGASSWDGPLRFELRAERTGRGFLRRAGERLGLLGRSASASIAWEEEAPEGIPRDLPYLRRVLLDLSGLEPGRYRVVLSLTAPGRTPAISEREIRIRAREAG